MPDFTVIRHGTDPNGRPILMTRYMAEWWERVTDELGFDPTIVQGAFMARVGGGAAASAGYHDLGGCLDLRVWDRSDDQVRRMVRVLRELGAAAWLRDHRHGMDPHIHFVLGTDQPLASGAAFQWRQYVRGRNGLADDGPDYHPRPRPLVLEPPEEDPMAARTDAEIKGLMAAAVAEALRPIETKLDQSIKRTDRVVNLLLQLRTKVKGGRVELREVERDLDRIAEELGAD